MALTKVTGGTISTTSDYQINNIVGVAGTFTTLNVSGVLTYEDVTNIESVGVATFKDDVQFIGNAANLTWDKSTDDLIFNDNAKAIFGTSSDGLEIYHASNHSYIADTGTGRLHINTNQLRVNNAADDEILIDATENTGVSLYDGANTVRLSTTGYGVTVFATTRTQKLHVTGISTFTEDVTFTGATSGRNVFFDKSENSLEFGDFTYAKFGASDDLTIFHSTSPEASLINNKTGELRIVGSGPIRLGKRHDATGAYAANMLVATPDGSIELHNNNSKKLETSGIGVTVSGDIDLDNGGSAGVNFRRNGTLKSDIEIGSASDQLAIRARGSDGHITFATTASTVERLRIKATGEVGIGQTNPGAMLQVDYDEGNSKVGLRLRAFNASNSKTWQLSEINGAAGTFTIRNATNSYNILNIDGINKRVGVGVNPSHPLHIKTQSGSGDEIVKIESESGYDARLQLDTSNGGGAGAHIDFQMDGTTKGGIEYVNNASSANVNCMLFRTTNNSEKFRIDSVGSIGQGTGTPRTPDGTNADNPLNGDGTDGNPVFTVYGDSPAINLVSSTTASGDYSLINFGRTGSSTNPYRAVIGYKQSNDILRINAQNAIAFDAGGNINTGEAARITSGGRFGIGTDSPDHIFEVESNNSSIAVSRSGSNAQLLFKSNSLGQAGQIQVDESSGGGYMDFYTKNTSGSLIKRLSMDTSGRLQTYGTLGVGNLPLAGNASDAALHIRCDNKYKGIALGENAVSGTIGLGGDDSSTALVYTANAHPANLGGGEHATHEWWSGTSGGSGPAKFMVLTTAGNLGIGTEGPDAKLDVGGAAPEIRLTNTNTSRSYINWYNHYGSSPGHNHNCGISYNEGNANWEFKLYRADAQANSPYGNIQFYTGSTSSPTLALNITRPGSVTMPKQPCCVMWASSATTWSSGWTKIPINNARFDVGNNFDSGNNRYSIPVTGKYAIGYNVELNIGSGQTWIYFVPRINRNDTTSTNAGINYADFAPMSNNSSNHYYSKQGHWIASLSQGDTVTFEMHGAGNAWTLANNNQSHYYVYQVA